MGIANTQARGKKMKAQQIDFNSEAWVRICRGLRLWRRLDEAGDEDSIYVAISITNALSELLDGAEPSVTSEEEQGASLVSQAVN
jgi:hypothetical protein